MKWWSGRNQDEDTWWDFRRLLRDGQCPSGSWRSTPDSIFRRPQRKPVRYCMYNWCEVMLDRGAGPATVGGGGREEGGCLIGGTEDWRDWAEWSIMKGHYWCFCWIYYLWCWATWEALMCRLEPSCCNCLGTLTAGHSDWLALSPKL